MVLGLLVVLSAVGLPVTIVRALDGFAPGGLQLGAAPPFLQLLAFTPWFALPCLLGAVVALLAGRRVVAVTLGVAVAAHLVWLTPAALALGPGGRQVDLTVLTVNARVGEAAADEVVALVRGGEVDVLVVVELTDDVVGELTAAGLGDELPHTVLAAAPGPAGAGIWSRSPARALPAVTGTTYAMPRARLQLEAADSASGEAAGEEASGEEPAGEVVVTAAHVAPPGLFSSEQWRLDLDRLGRSVAGPELSADEPRQVVAGSFSATRDHAPYRALVQVVGRDAADDRGRGLRPTWPHPSPVVAVDHVLVSEDVRVGRVERFPVTGTDHVGVLATLRLP